MIQSKKFIIYAGVESIDKIQQQQQKNIYTKLISIKCDNHIDKQLVLIEQANAKYYEGKDIKLIQDISGLQIHLTESKDEKSVQLIINNRVLKELIDLKIIVQGNVENINQSILKLLFIKIQLPNFINQNDELEIHIVGFKIDPNNCLNNSNIQKQGYMTKDCDKMAEIIKSQLTNAIKLYDKKDWKSAHRFITPFSLEIQLKIKITNIKNPSYKVQPLSVNNNNIYTMIYLQLDEMNQQIISKNIEKGSNQLLQIVKNNKKRSICRFLSFIPRKIYNPHLFIKTNRKEKYLQYYTKGIYQYYHYGDQNFNDQGWGCAYRSLQTILSWLYIQNYLKISSIPTLAKIQELIDRINIGSKQRFKGTQEWIGATEVSWVIKKLTDYDCRIIHVSDGNQILENCQIFREHFEKVGSPVMYGGGQYAYSIVGMNYSWKLGQCQFLILDPHYNGSDNMDKIFEKKGLCWRKPEQMFKKGVFYNFCLPLI